MNNLTHKELLKRWKKGCKWLSENQHLTNTNKNKLLEIYDHQMYSMALERIERIEDELRSRGIKYGK